LVRYRVILIGLVALTAIAYELYAAGVTRLFLGPAVQVVSSYDEIGMRPVECWFSPAADWPDVDCYMMQVPENHDLAGERVIAYPVAIFHANTLLRYKNPVLHLGAGGPGAALGLDSTPTVRRLWEYHAPMSIEQGRDLFMIDPRGAGLARPALVCEKALEKGRAYLPHDMSLAQALRAGSDDYRECLRQYQADGVDLGQYNSLAVARDVEQMRLRSYVKQWVLVGVSYASVYAQVIVRKYPSTVEAMILDSAVMLGRKWDDNFVNRQLAPWRDLVAQCRSAGSCSGGLPQLMERLSALHRSLDEAPRTVTVEDPYGEGRLTVTINGNRFLNLVLFTIHRKDIFEDVMPLLANLEYGNTEAIVPYLEESLKEALTPDYSGVSAIAHYCHDEKPFLDFTQMRVKARDELTGLVRERTLKHLDTDDNCDLIGTKPPGGILDHDQSVDVPTLFLHGNRDTITPIEDVLSQQHLYKSSKVLRFDVSHSVLTAHECAHYASAWFVEDPEIPLWKLYCQ